MIIRAPRPDTGYLIIRNDVLRDSRLSLRARGLLALILSRPDNWHTDASQLAAENPEGRDAILTAMKELRAVGYMRQERTRDPKTGQIGTNTYVFDHPETDPPESENPTSGVTREDSALPLVAPETGLPESENPTPIEVPSKKNQKNTLQRPSFADFYAAYPKKVEKRAAEAKWNTITRTVDPALIMAGLARYTHHLAAKRTEPQYIKGPAVWLNKGCWDDVYDTPSVRAVPVYADSPVPDPESLPWAVAE